MRKCIIILSLFTLILSACGRPTDKNTNDDDKSYTIRVAYLVSEEQSTHLAAKTFKEKLENESEGRISVELYPNGQLYPSDREAIEAVQLNNVEMTIPALAPVASFNKKFMVFDLPFLFKDYESVYKTLDGSLGQELLKELESDGLKGLAYAENGFRHISNNDGPIEKPEDLKGLKLRSMENPVHTETFKTYGANASPFAFGELYTALQQGTYDAMESPISLYYTNKFYEVQDYLTISGHFYAATILLMNNEFFNSLPEDLQSLVNEAAEEYRDEQRQIAQEQDKEWLESLKESGMQINTLSEEQIEVFRNAAEPVYDKFKSEIGEDIVDQAIEINK
ncbi:DctP family TRAP transporter solute-binding subunit [Pseudogracilibacillus auburnensis]|uniref:Tripartite ATP-independent transporter DctP family solute receptor n=1 Tax=Pseudogracilibacillus auburnensis TaxID=1494959 RepID=A0A2V3VJG5_9BACI|nr:DctP family TRAP transporter solute-binding subunit [Pseudogracilibacillus auburnensis]MBO1002732.1 DctP family TRAP transporter solute-binding subunit [Pseudogracilibacillus auburnensis]PXW81700.1 tripartite ATP-independent transporter DctP family solute receptor [Pseudogracilibacillus auburnensis]